MRARETGENPVMHLMGSNGITYCGWPMPGLLPHELTGFYSDTTCQACKEASGMTKFCQGLA